MEHLTAFLTRMPKVELHVHLESTMPGEMLARFAARQGRELPRPAGRLYDCSAEDLSDFLAFLDNICSFVGTPEELAEAAEHAALESGREHILYSEMILNPTHWPQFSVPEIIAAVTAGFDRAAARGGADCRFTLSLSRTQTGAEAMALVEDMKAHRTHRLAGLSIDGNEALAGRTGERFRPAFLAAGARNLHVVDLDGAKDGTLSNYDTIAALAKQGGLYIEVGGGIRTEERIEKYLALGVGRCILGSVAVTDFAFTARMLQKYGYRIAVGVDAKDGYVAIHGWKEVSAEPGVDFCRRLADAGCTAIIYTDIACDGAMQGTNLALYRQLAAEVPGVAFTASGGISSEAELLELKEMGTAAAILGKSLYTGALDLERCVQLVQD